MAPFLLGSNGVAEQQPCPLLPGMQQPILLSSPHKTVTPLLAVLCGARRLFGKCAASRALQQPSRSFSTPLVACRRSRARCAAPSATPLKPMLVVDATLRALPVRWNVDPCGQPMRLVMTHSG
ncbi:hypothetical protein ZEAMMB73_Zm00001d040417 [Zea mays]|uniref:Uncharacterized protein n=1 Tax=Zea mays TaxID=4577 RepID=A0A1D6MQM3_MAIZE|nr:hypothetical protein ZEAMMB73_Zm00001d040417 [Zea mays]